MPPNRLPSPLASLANRLKTRFTSPEDLAQGLWKAVETNNLEQVKTILAYGPKAIEVIDSRRLITLAVKRPPEMLEALVAAGAHLVMDATKNTQADMAAFHTFYWQKPHVQELFLAHTPDVNIRCKAGATALIHLADKGDTAHAKHLLEGAKRLLDRGADVNAVDRMGRTALMHSKTFPDLVQLLLEAGAKPDLQSHDGRTALHIFAADRTEPGTVSKGLLSMRLLLQAGVNAQIQDCSGLTARSIANVNENKAGLELLEAADASAKAQRAIGTLLGPDARQFTTDSKPRPL